MTVGMLTLGNLGMLFGCWADLGFAPIKTCSCGCTTPLRGIGMWLGMLLFGNLAMALGLRRAPDGKNAIACRWAMFGGGNLGMTAGMFASGYCVDPQQFGAVVHLVAMSTGMIVGMLVGHFMVLQLFTMRKWRSSWSDKAMTKMWLIAGRPWADRLRSPVLGKQSGPPNNWNAKGFTAT
jgi:hypothetical protein